MKKKLLLGCFFVLCLFPQLFAQSVSLDEAVKRKIVQIGIVGNGGYSGKCIKLTLINRSAKALSINIPAGWIFASEDSTSQDLMVVKEEEVRLVGRDRQSMDLQGMCTQSHNASPSKGELFTLGQQAEEHLLTLAQLISKKSYQNSTAQSAVWSVANGADVNSIYGMDTTMVRDIANVVSEATGHPISVFNFEPRQHNITSMTSSMEMLFKEHTDGVSLRAYTENGTVIREYFNDKYIEKGFFYMKLGVFHTLEPETKVFLRLEQGDHLLAEKEINTQSRPMPLQKVFTESVLSFSVEKRINTTVAVYDSAENLYMLMRENYWRNRGDYRGRYEVKTYLPEHITYFMKVKDTEGNTLASEKLFIDENAPKRYPRKVERGVFNFQLQNDLRHANIVIYTEAGKKVKTLFEDSTLGRGYKRIPFSFFHYENPEEKLYIKLEDATGNVLAEQCINCK